MSIALRCHACGHEGLPVVKRVMNGTGWTLFWVLLLFCFPLVWLPFVISSCQDDVRHCARCGVKIG